ncbi:hypothetical protein [Streptomyces sp. NPDC096311]|uniref:hypothetical protein n=1 Tax=Streptomyces sp. NPDC096311 TaxID=3366083 RepID=UPI00382601E2
MVDNAFEAVLASAEGVTRASVSAGRTTARQFAGGEALAGLRAEHGFSALVTVQSGDASSTLLFDTGASPDGLAVNAERLGIGVCRVLSAACLVGCRRSVWSAVCGWLPVSRVCWVGFVRVGWCGVSG